MTASFLQRILVAAAFVALAITHAHAGIPAFNDAVKAGDYKAAAAEAVSTWPTLDKTRPDIRIIASEFGFMSYLAGDFASAQTFSEFAANPTASGARPEPQHLVLWRLSQHKLAPTRATRDQLFEALTARSASPDTDNISFVAASALLAYDLNEGDWKNAQGSSAVGLKLMKAGGSGYQLESRRFELFAAVADYMRNYDGTVWDRLTDLRNAMAADIDAAPSDEAAKRFVPLVWETRAWRESIETHMRARKISMRERERREKEKSGAWVKNPERHRKIFDTHATDGDRCQRARSDSQNPKYPPSAAFRGFIGSVVLQIDIDETGAASNPVILAAVPDRPFGQAVLDSAPRFKYRPDKKWDATCSLAEKGHVVLVNFQIGVDR